METHNPDDGESTDRDGSRGLYLENKESRVFSSQVRGAALPVDVR